MTHRIGTIRRARADVSAILLCLSFWGNGDGRLAWYAPRPLVEIDARLATDDPIQDLVDMIFPASGVAEEVTEDRQLHAAHEDALRSCMQAAGFSYIALPYGGMSVVLSLQAELDKHDFVDQYGYGIVTLIEAEDQQSAVNTFAAPDPNEAVRAALPPAEQATYDEARWGAGTMAGESGPIPADPSAGCEGRASRVYAPALLPTAASMELKDLEATITADRRTVAAEAAWSVCMTAQGWDFRTTVDAPASVRALLDNLTMSASSATMEVSGPNGSTVTIEVPSYNQADLAAAATLERRVAGADQSCRDETNYDATIAAVTNEHRRDFVQRWIDRIDVQGP